MDEVVEALEKYQGLVPLVYDIETMSLDEARPEDMLTAVYLKREADKAIEELKKEKEYVIEQTAEVINGQEEELRHHKYKRCLAMAKWCDAKADWYYSIGEFFRDRVEFYIKWRDRWLKIAKKFKEAK